MPEPRQIAIALGVIAIASGAAIGAFIGLGLWATSGSVPRIDELENYRKWKA